jgi:RNA polymerase primary sigma factor
MKIFSQNMHKWHIYCYIIDKDHKEALMTATKERTAKKTVPFNSDENILALYLQEIGRIPLLSRTEEDEVARTAVQGDKLARDKLINGNLRFVVNVAKKYQGRGLPLTDLISEGNMGLMMALDRYDAGKGYHFISYAVWWIRQAILKALSEKVRMIRLPQNRVYDLLQIEKARRVLQEHQSAKKEIQEIADFLEMDPAVVEELLSISRDMISLEYPVLVDQDTVLGDFIEDEQRPGPDQNTVQSVLADDIEDILNSMDKKEAVVLRMRYGLGNNPAMSLKEIGDHFNISKERVRQIETKALRRLQHPARKEKLTAYVA